MTEQELQKIAAEFVVAKGEADRFKKQADNLNSSIKRNMEVMELDKVSLPDGTSVCYSVQHRESLDEEKLIVLLKQLAPDTECIKTKEYIDMDILENEMYHDKLSPEALTAMDTCRNVKEVPMLTIKKSKKEK